MEHIWLVERHGVEEAYTVAAFSTEELALVFIDDQKDYWMYDCTDMEVDVGEEKPLPAEEVFKELDEESQEWANEGGQ